MDDITTKQRRRLLLTHSKVIHQTWFNAAVSKVGSRDLQGSLGAPVKWTVSHYHFTALDNSTTVYVLL